ncbi:hypothetical protein [Streptomyces sp. NRRL F-4711]|uniref:hypothetical protein n=1 Tax=Streptomyces sp. NRRL F-4711 TaxID=1519476 RepID=UPI001F383099|nr:hypothetical protein [Streptomyces sp. NRRL F-4711]
MPESACTVPAPRPYRLRTPRISTAGPGAGAVVGTAGVGAVVGTAGVGAVVGMVGVRAVVAAVVSGFPGRWSVSGR